MTPEREQQLRQQARAGGGTMWTRWLGEALNALTAERTAHAVTRRERDALDHERRLTAEVLRFDACIATYEAARVVMEERERAERERDEAKGIGGRALLAAGVERERADRAESALTAERTAHAEMREAMELLEGQIMAVGDEWDAERRAHVKAKEECQRLRDRTEEQACELLAFRESADRPRCLYCDLGAVDLVTVEVLKWHIRKECVAHPLYQAEARADRAEQERDNVDRDYREHTDTLNARLAVAESALGATRAVVEAARGALADLIRLHEEPLSNDEARHPEHPPAECRAWNFPDCQRVERARAALAALDSP